MIKVAVFLTLRLKDRAGNYLMVTELVEGRSEAGRDEHLHQT